MKKLLGAKLNIISVCVYTIISLMIHGDFMFLREQRYYADNLVNRFFVTYSYMYIIAIVFKHVYLINF